MKKIQQFLKVAVSCMIIVSIIFSNQKLASAQWVVIDPTNLIQNTINAINAPITSLQTTISALTDTKFWIKDSILDRIFVALAKKLINKIKDNMITWINSGFKGKPLYLDKPEQFFKNIGIEQLSLVKTQLLSTAAYANADIYKALQKDLNNTFKISITPTVDTAILDGLCPSTEKYIQDNQDRIATRTLNGENVSQREYDYFNKKKDTYDKYCSGGVMTKEKYDGLMNAWASDASNGGWGPLIAITQNQDRNTEQGRLLLAKAELAKKIEVKTTQANSELNRSGGFLDQKKCTEYYENSEDPDNVVTAADKQCKTWVTITPGKAAADMLGQVVTDPIQQAQLVKTINDAIDAVLGAFVSKITTDGLAAAQGVLSNFGQQTLTASSSEYALTVNDKDFLVKTLIPQAQQKLKDQKRIRTYIQKEYDRYAEVFNAYNDVYICYKNRGDEASIPNAIKIRAGEVKAKMDSIQKELTNSSNAETLIANYINNVNTATNLNQIDIINKQFDADIAVGKIFDVTTYAQRNIDNEGGLFDALRAEISSVAAPALNYCQSIDSSRGGN